MRPGWGLRHPELARVLAGTKPIATTETAWANGTVPLRVAAYAGLVDLPDELVLSVRCLVRVGERLVVCTNVDGIAHPWPGGRREPGESLAETAVREVHEETGWLLQAESFRLLGWLHLEHLLPVPGGYPWPNPDFCQVVGTAEAVRRTGGIDSDWRDTEGYEARSELMLIGDALAAVGADPVSHAFVELLAQNL